MCELTTVIGCSRSELPSVPGAKVEVAPDGRSAVVECEHAQRDGYVRWSIKCVDDKWRGNVGNCTGAAVADGNNQSFYAQFCFRKRKIKH